jgi:soluble lytic murein transglycosylase-like protein
MLEKVVIIVVLILLFSAPPIAAEIETDLVYDVQCGCYRNPANGTLLATRLEELGLTWYTRQMDRCTRFILDLNIDSRGLTAFAKTYPEFDDAFLVKNLWDIPHPTPKVISPLPTAEEFTAVMTPYLRKQYKYGYYNRKRHSLAKERAQLYTRWIYEAANYYGLDPFLLFAVGNFETYFRNMLGDRDRLQRRRPDPALGMFQILRSTSRVIYRDMKNRNLPHTPRKLPSNLIIQPKDQIYFAAHYLDILRTRHHGNRYMALRAYNGIGAETYDYPRRVMRFYQKAIDYYAESSPELPEKPEPSPDSRQAQSFSLTSYAPPADIEEPL